MRNLQKRERKPMGSLRKLLSTAVLAAGLTVLPSCVTAPKPKPALTPAIISKKAKSPDPQRKRTVKRKLDDVSATLDDMAWRLEDDIIFTAKIFGVKHKDYEKLFPVEGRAQVIRTGESVSLWCGSPKATVKIDSTGVFFGRRHYLFGELHLQDDRVFSFMNKPSYATFWVQEFPSLMTVRKRPDGSAMLYLVTPRGQMPE